MGERGEDELINGHSNHEDNMIPEGERVEDRDR